MKKLIVVGASSGIGRALAELALKSGWTVGITARRTALLEEIQTEFPDSCHIQTMDVSQAEESRNQLENLFQKMGGADVIVVNAGVTNSNSKNSWEKDSYTLGINVVGAAALSNKALELLAHQGTGHLLGISSVAAFASIGRSAMYSASKAFLSSFLHGLRGRARALKSEVIVTDVKPGFIATDMIADLSGTVMVIGVERAASILFRSFGKNKAVLYLPERWRFVSWIVRLLPLKWIEKVR